MGGAQNERLTQGMKSTETRPNLMGELPMASQKYLLVDRNRKPNSLPVIQEETFSDPLSHLDPHKSMGLDGIHPRLMRDLVEELAKPLPNIYQQCWLSGEIPDDWKLANVTPIHKKGCKEEPGNYKPVSLTSVPGKVMEQIILCAITQHLQVGQGIRPS
ncbi:hypothetical protein BTVI_45630 [Pitangus sulphuratus]|nr:hypothetical protein BTVI_45630 [Pitangus sulphuratus]